MATQQATKATTAPAADQPQDPATPDAHAGQGGSYQVDPATGRRTLVHRTDTARPARATTTPPADPPAQE